MELAAFEAFHLVIKIVVAVVQILVTVLIGKSSAVP